MTNEQKDAIVKAAQEYVECYRLRGPLHTEPPFLILRAAVRAAEQRWTVKKAGDCWIVSKDDKGSVPFYSDSEPAMLLARLLNEDEA